MRAIFALPLSASVLSFFGAAILIIGFVATSSLQTRLMRFCLYLHADRCRPSFFYPLPSIFRPVLFMTIADLVTALNGIISYTPAVRRRGFKFMYTIHAHISLCNQVLGMESLHNTSVVACKVAAAFGDFSLQVPGPPFACPASCPRVCCLVLLAVNYGTWQTTG